jgi:transcriptional regulator with XRE-family HTH domain
MESGEELPGPEGDAGLAARLKAARLARGLTLEALAEAAGVSRAMISRVERGESSPTAALLDRLATGLGLTLSALFHVAPPAGPLARRAAQALWRDPESGYLRRAVTPPGCGSRVEIVEVELPAGARVLLDSPRTTQRLDQQIWLLAGALEISVGGETHALCAGDCLHMLLAGPIAYHNPGDAPARYAVVLTVVAGPFRGD